jgi:hypothetical protein
VAIDDINLRYTAITIDDGSGATIELKIVRIPPTEQNPVDTSSNTKISNLDIICRFGIFDVVVDGQPLDIGSVVKAKCTISEFRGNKQLELQRISVITTTDEEARAWAETAAFKQAVLSRPWHISRSEHKQIKHAIKMEEKRERDYAKRKAEYEVKKEEHRLAREAYFAQREKRLEARRRKEEVMLNSGALI